MTYSTLIIDNFIDNKDLDLLIESFNDAPFDCAPNNPNLFSYQIPRDYIHRAITDTINEKLTKTLEEHYKRKISQYTSGSVTRYKEGQYGYCRVGGMLEDLLERVSSVNFNKYTAVTCLAR